MKKLRLALGVVFVLWFSLFFAPLCSAEQAYYMTPAELQTLQQRLTTLKQQRAILQQEYQLLKAQQEKLDKQVTQLETQLAESRALSNKLETQLKTVNESFKQYAKEERTKLRRTKFERNILFCGLLYGGFQYLKDHN